MYAKKNIFFAVILIFKSRLPENFKKKWTMAGLLPFARWARPGISFGDFLPLYLTVRQRRKGRYRLNRSLVCNGRCTWWVSVENREMDLSDRVPAWFQYRDLNRNNELQYINPKKAPGPDNGSMVLAGVPVMKSNARHRCHAKYFNILVPLLTCPQKIMWTYALMEMVVWTWKDSPLLWV